MDPMAHLRTQTASNPRGHPELPWGPTWKPPGESTTQEGPPRGRPTPQVCWTTFGSTHPRLTRVSSWLVPRPIPVVLAVPHKVIQPLLIEEMGITRGQHTWRQLLTFVSSPLLLSWLRLNFTSPWVCVCVEDLA
jgi:hypothetical protein